LNEKFFADFLFGDESSYTGQGGAAMTYRFARRLNWNRPTLTLAVLFFLGACSSAAPPKPVEIAEGDTCTFCKKPIADMRFAAEFITKDGFVRKFDDIGCMIEHSKKGNRNAIAAFFTVDHDKKNWMKAEDMSYLRSKNLNTPGGSGIAAFADKSRTQALAAQFQGEAVGFEDLMK
jgi:nitrous oxide reductase accessory protein NosL